MNFQLVPFNQLAPRQLWSILKLRQQIFVLEQQCLFPEIDDHDPVADHLLATQPDQPLPQALMAYCRILPPGLRFPEPCISRVVVLADQRRTGLGRLLMQEAIARIERQHGFPAIRISAQQHLLAFYQTVGFQPTGKRYLEDDIWHQDMYRPPGSSEQ